MGVNQVFRQEDAVQSGQVKGMGSVRVVARGVPHS